MSDTIGQHTDRVTWMLRLLSDASIVEADTAAGDDRQAATIRNQARAIDACVHTVTLIGQNGRDPA